MKTRPQTSRHQHLAAHIQSGVVLLLLLLLGSCHLERATPRNDPDHDGVVARRDKCPDTPAGVAVDANGCPLDSDGDGIADSQDRCPTESGPVLTGGCPDRDSDGVADNQDACPDRAGPARNKGCPEMAAMQPPTQPPDPAEAQRAALEAHEQAEDKRRVTVFFCTNRNLLTGEPAVTFGIKSAGPRYGSCRVSIPRDHKMGQVEVPLTVFGLELEKPDPARHMMVLATRLLSQQDLLRELNAKSDASARRDAFIFVHGFNNTFQQAMLRTAQFTYDLGFQGAPVLFSWPSQGSGLPTAYRTDALMSKAAVEPFKSFLRTFLRQSTATNIYLIAHSMGNRIMLATLQDLMVREPELFRNKHVREIVLTAPDVSVQVFRQQIAPVINSKVANITLYASDDDKALRVSRVLNQARRAGQAGAGLLLLPGIETIDATGVATDFLAHSYFASEGSVVGDLHYMFGGNLRADQRTGLQRQLRQRYWKFKPKTTGPGVGK